MIGEFNDIISTIDVHYVLGIALCVATYEIGDTVIPQLADWGLEK